MRGRAYHERCVPSPPSSSCCRPLSTVAVSWFRSTSPIFLFACQRESMGEARAEGRGGGRAGGRELRLDNLATSGRTQNQQTSTRFDTHVFKPGYIVRSLMSQTGIHRSLGMTLKIDQTHLRTWLNYIIPWYEVRGKRLLTDPSLPRSRMTSPPRSAPRARPRLPLDPHPSSPSPQFFRWAMAVGASSVSADKPQEGKK